MGSEYVVELRPVYMEDPPADWGIRSSRFRLDSSGAHLHSAVPSIRASSEVVDSADHLTCSTPDHVLRLKTWLGLRYNRPAIPEEYIKLAKKLADKIKAKRNTEHTSGIRDILARFNTAPNGSVLYELIAVLPHQNADVQAVSKARTWLSEIALSVSTDLGIAKHIQAYPDTAISIAYVEDSYSLDVAQVSWPASYPGPRGTV